MQVPKNVGAKFSSVEAPDPPKEDKEGVGVIRVVNCIADRYDDGRHRLGSYSVRIEGIRVGGTVEPRPLRA